MWYLSMSDELLKMAVSAAEAEKAMRKLHDLEEKKPSGGEIARGALAGGVAGTASSLARAAVGGGLKSGIQDALKARTVAGKVGRLAGGAAKGLGTSMAGAAAFGSTLPFVRGYLDREAEKAKLRDYLGVSRGGKVRRKAKKVLGV